MRSASHCSHGGQACSSTADCPHQIGSAAAGGARACLLRLQPAWLVREAASPGRSCMVCLRLRGEAVASAVRQGCVPGPGRWPQLCRRYPPAGLPRVGRGGAVHRAVEGGRGGCGEPLASVRVRAGPGAVRRAATSVPCCCCCCCGGGGGGAGRRLQQDGGAHGRFGLCSQLRRRHVKVAVSRRAARRRLGRRWRAVEVRVQPVGRPGGVVRVRGAAARGRAAAPARRRRRRVPAGCGGRADDQ